MSNAGPPSYTFVDALILAAANTWAHLRHPRLALTSMLRMRRLVNFARPSSHGEMMQWRKVFDRNSAFAVYADKLAAKRWAKRICPDLLTAEVLWEGDAVADLPEAMLTPGHVIKTNNGCARNYMPHRAVWPRAVLERRLRRWLKSRWARLGEWAYSQIEPRLFVERLIGDGRPLLELTFRAFDGKVPLAFAATDWKTEAARAAYLDSEGRRLSLVADGAEALAGDFAVPTAAFERARHYAEQLSRGVDHMRLDFLIDGEDVYFGEVTLYTASGYGDEDRLGLGHTLLGHWFDAIDKSDFLVRPRSWPASLYQSAFRRWTRRHAAELEASPVEKLA